MSYVGSSAAVIPVGFSGVNSQSFNGDGSTVAFTLNRPVSAVNAIEVMVNNVQQSPYDGSYSVSSTTLTFSAAPSSGTANIYVVYRDFPVGSITDPNTYTKAQTDALIGAVDLSSRVAKTGDTMTGALQMQTSNEVQFWTTNYGIRAFDGLEIKAGDHFRFLKGTTEQMRIDSAGRVTMPYQPAFQVRLSATQGLSAGVRTKVNFDTIDYENGSNYSTANKRFTAPVTGFYQFNVIVYAYTVNNHEVTLWKNSSLFIRSQFASASNVNPVNGVLVAATKLTAGDYVEIYSVITSSGDLYSSAERPTTWSGFLIG